MIHEFFLFRTCSEGFGVGRRKREWDVCAPRLEEHFPLITEQVDKVRVLITDCPDLIDEPTLEAFVITERPPYGYGRFHYLDIDDCFEELMENVGRILSRHFKAGEPMYIYAEPIV
jgi:hypothetical protein